MNLSEEDREQLNEWLLTNSYSYTQVLELLARPRSEGGLGVRSHRASLSHYYHRVMPGWIDERRQRSLHIARHFHDAETGQFDLPTIEAVKQRAFETVLNPEADPGLLKSLLRTVLKLQDQQLAREKLDLATAKTIQAERIAQIESAGCNPYRTSVTEIDTILKERVALRNASKPAPKPAPAGSVPMAETSHPLSAIISAVTDEGQTPLLDPLTIERQKLLAVLKAKLQLDQRAIRANPNTPPSTALDDLQDSLDDILAARSELPPVDSIDPATASNHPDAPIEDLLPAIPATTASPEQPAPSESTEAECTANSQTTVPINVREHLISICGNETAVLFERHSPPHPDLPIDSVHPTLPQ
jgi:hypothetical protein